MTVVEVRVTRPSMSFGLVLSALNADLVGAGRSAALADAARACAEAAR